MLEALPLRASASPEAVTRAAGLGVAETLAALGALEIAGLAERRGGAGGVGRRQAMRGAPDCAAGADAAPLTQDAIRPGPGCGLSRGARRPVGVAVRTAHHDDQVKGSPLHDRRPHPGGTRPPNCCRRRAGARGLRGAPRRRARPHGALGPRLRR
nr:hypothetical protein [Paraoerskovia sediminicola]